MPREIPFDPGASIAALDLREAVLQCALRDSALSLPPGDRPSVTWLDSISTVRALASLSKTTAPPSRAAAASAANFARRIPTRVDSTSLCKPTPTRFVFAQVQFREGGLRPISAGAFVRS